MEKNTHYYTVAVALDAIWEEIRYTYRSDEVLAAGQIVIVPFGKEKKVGYVLEETEQPEFATKRITQVKDVFLSQQNQQLLNWLQEFYPGAAGVQLQYLLPSLLKTKLDHPQPAKLLISKKAPALTSTQQRACEEITGSDATTVLQGITGSGKTRLYCELAKDYVQNGQDVVLLYPEISLTSQLETELKGFFGASSVYTYHSKQTMTKQRKTWLAAHDGPSGTGRIFIGPRSALFLPLQNIGLIIVDEAHDAAYKQDSGSRYNGILVAAALASTHKAKLVLGSATPPVQETHQVVTKGGQLVYMHEQAKPTETAKNFVTVDMRDKNNRSKRSHLLSKILIQAIRSSVENKQQALVFLNKRGTARMLLCEECGWHAACADCEMPLVYHHDSFRTKCHVCGANSQASSSCPDCSNGLTQRSPGTKAIEQELATLFPDASIARFDSDNLKSESLSERYEAISSGDVDIIIGTQLLTKGLDLPRLDTVGIVQADSSLLLPDYTSEERAFQQLTQVSGRVGRGHTADAHVIVQTYHPEHKLFEFVTKEDWPAFYEYELQQRRDEKYPPYSYAMRIWSVKPSVESAKRACQKLADELKSVQGLTVLGPAPSFYEKRAGKYSWQLVLRSSSRKQLMQVAKQLPTDVFYDLDPVSLL